MLKNIFAVIGGFVLWSAFWVVSDLTLLILSPDWYGEGLKSFSIPVLLISLARSIFISLISGYIAALIAKKNQIQTALVLGVLLLAFGIFIQAQFWNVIPLWYHLIFLALLIPMTWLGAKLRTA
ncbi:MAG TPA: hypothetical protein VEQ34_03380 [Pyrinomonadaceae bacterium]|nr:hypothetical protein [Pyrinomonadaceae bacterium]